MKEHVTSLAEVWIEIKIFAEIFKVLLIKLQVVKNTEQTFDLFCTFFILNDILDK